MNLEYATIKEIKALFYDGDLTSTDLVLYYLDRIATIDQGEPKYNSVFEVNPDALHIAAQKDYERNMGKVDGVLHGIPVLLKDNINTGDKTHTTAGANILKEHYALKDAKLVKQLRKEGAIILGKTNLTEFACFKSFDGVNGYSSLSGFVLCPWDIKEDPSGSSTGSAVAAALNFAPVTVGTETLGSIMSPSAKNGVVGLKPTIGLISREGIVPISATTDTADPIGRTVSDVAYLLSGLRCNDKFDPITLTKKDEFVDYTKYLVIDNLQRKKVGLIKNHFDKLSIKEQKAYETVIETLKLKGVETIEIELEEPKNVLPVLYNEFKATLNSYLSNEGLKLTLKDIIKYNEANSEENLKYGQQVFLDVENKTSGKMNELEYIESLKERNVFYHKIDQLFDDEKIDMLYFANFTSIGAFCGFPTLTIPIGLNEKKMPIGTFFLARKFREDILLHLAYNIEQSLNLKMNPLNQ